MRTLPVFAAVLTVGCAPERLEFGPPDAPGPWQIGTTEHQASGPGGVELPLQIWYPTLETSGTIATYEKFEIGSSLEDATPDCMGAQPVVVFSHGNSGFRFQSVFLMEHLASHGFVVVAPDHVGNTAFDMSLERTDAALRRPLDVAAAFDAVSTDPAWAACIDPAQGYAVVGHSFGGWTSLATAGATIDLAGLEQHCETGRAHLCGLQDDPALADERVWAAVPLAPSGAHSLGAGIANVTVPTRVIAGVHDKTNTWDNQAQPIFERLPSPAQLVGLDGVGHYSFAFPCLDPNDGCGSNFIEPERAQEQISALTTGFLTEQLGAAPWTPESWPGLVWQSK